MNEAPNQNTGLNDTFSSQPSPQTNPFTADLKGEFTSNFGTNTNAVSQIFKEGGFVSNNRTKYLIIGGIAVIALAAVLYFVTSDDDSEGEKTAAEETSGDDSDKEETASVDKAKAKAEKEQAEKAKAAEDEAKKKAEEAQAQAKKPAAVPASVPKAKAAGMGGSGAITLAEPADGSSLSYDETQGAANFSWQGRGGSIIFSRNASMKPISHRARVTGNSYSFNHPWPGTWYWKVENRSGSTEVRSFKVSAPPRRNVQLSQPAAGSAIAGSGGTVTWQGDAKVAFYRVELANGSWANPTHRFASSGNSVQLQGVAAGQYQMRIGAFSEIAGRWEYTAPIQVTVQ